MPNSLYEIRVGDATYQVTADNDTEALAYAEMKVHDHQRLAHVYVFTKRKRWVLIKLVQIPSL